MIFPVCLPIVTEQILQILISEFEVKRQEMVFTFLRTEYRKFGVYAIFRKVGKRKIA